MNIARMPPTVSGHKLVYCFAQLFVFFFFLLLKIGTKLNAFQKCDIWISHIWNSPLNRSMWHQHLTVLKSFNVELSETPIWFSSHFITINSWRWCCVETKSLNNYGVKRSNTERTELSDGVGFIFDLIMSGIKRCVEKQSLYRGNQWNRKIKFLKIDHVLLFRIER